MWLICRIVDSTGKQLGSEKFHESDEALTLGTLFHNLDPPTTDLMTVKAVFLSESGKPGDAWTAADLTHPVSLVSEFKKPHVKFVVDVAPPIPPRASGANAFDRLMAGSRRQSQLEQQRHRPQLLKPKNSSSPGFIKKDALRNHIIEGILEKNNLLFKDKHQADTDGVLMLRVITDVLWNIDEHHEKINHRATFNADVSSIPDVFLSCRGFNDNRKKKHAIQLERKAVENLTLSSLEYSFFVLE